MKYKIAKPFSNGTEYEIFRDNYCDNGCEYHKEREDGFVEFTENGGCPIEDGMENARFKIECFPNVLLEAWDGEKCINWHHCPFYRKDANKQLEALSTEHPYKVVGQPETYSQYNEGWQDCLDRIMQIVKGGGVDENNTNR